MLKKLNSMEAVLLIERIKNYSKSMPLDIALFAKEFSMLVRSGIKNFKYLTIPQTPNTPKSILKKIDKVSFDILIANDMILNTHTKLTTILLMRYACDINDFKTIKRSDLTMSQLLNLLDIPNNDKHLLHMFNKLRNIIAHKHSPYAILGLDMRDVQEIVDSFAEIILFVEYTYMDYGDKFKEMSKYLETLDN